MSRRKLLALLAVTSLVGTTAMLIGGGSAGAAASGFVTSERPYLVRLVNGVKIKPLITAGDVVGGRHHGYQMSGTPDGLGAYSTGSGTVELFMNHELSPRFDYAGARVSHLTLNGSGAVTAASYAIDGTEGFEWFCSSSLASFRGVPWYFTGEESANSPNGGGTSIALNASSGNWVETPQFGHLSHENVVPVQGLSKAYLGISEDGFHGTSSQMYSYQSDRFTAAIHGLGSLRVWVPDQGVPDGNPSSNDIHKGATVSGHFERIAARDNFNSATLEKAAQRKGAWDFVRIEDQTADPYHPGTVYFSETGAANREVTHGRVYKLSVDPAHPTQADLSVVLDAAAGDDIFSPDNLGISNKALVIQEDRNWTKSGFNRVLVYNLKTGSLTPVARADPPQGLIDERGPGVWETSGVVDASAYYGTGWWLLDVQAHHFDVSVPGPSLKVDSATGEGGQLELVHIPGT